VESVVTSILVEGAELEPKPTRMTSKAPIQVVCW